MQVDREEHHQFVLALPYNLHGTTVYVCHGISSGAWGLGWATPWLDTVIINIFHIIIKVFVNCYLLQLGEHILIWSSFCFFFLQLQNSVAHTARSQPHHSEMCKTWGLYCFSGFFCCPTPLTTPHLIFIFFCSNLHLFLWIYNLMPNLLGLVGTSWE